MKVWRKVRACVGGVLESESVVWEGQHICLGTFASQSCNPIREQNTTASLLCMLAFSSLPPASRFPPSPLEPEPRQFRDFPDDRLPRASNSPPP